jgi:putative Flp pilus-assembly TadE/G-like protein
MHCFSAEGSRSESGQAFVLTVFCLAAVCGFVGSVVDVSAIRAARRHPQNTADAAALAGAIGSRIKIGVAILLFSLTVPAAAARIPDAPQPRVPLTDKLLLGIVVAGRAGDAISTHQFLMAGDKESSLPNWVVCTQSRMWTYSMAVAAGQVVISRLLLRHRQVRIARTLEVMHAAFIWDTVVHNKLLLAHHDIKVH